MLKTKSHSYIINLFCLGLVSVLFTNCSNYQEQMVYSGSKATTTTRPDVQTSGDLVLGTVECPVGNPETSPSPSTNPQQVLYISGECDVGRRTSAEYKIKVAIVASGQAGDINPVEVQCNLGRFHAAMNISNLAPQTTYDMVVTLSSTSNETPPLNVPCPFRTQ